MSWVSSSTQSGSPGSATSERAPSNGNEYQQSSYSQSPSYGGLAFHSPSSQPEKFILNKNLPRCRQRRAISRAVLNMNLPALHEASLATRSKLLIKKLRLCCYTFSFDPNIEDTMQEAKEKDIKRATLAELSNHLAVYKPSFTDEEMREIFEMLACNLFRPLPPSSLETNPIFNPEEDTPQGEPAWPHLQPTYEFFLRLVSGDVDAKLLGKYISKRFVLQLLDLFDSEDARERDYLKNILHRIYGNFMQLRPFIRRAINNALYRFIYETDRHNGVGEMLEILASIINGFALPLKGQHKSFLERVLLPLHKVTYLSIFHPQLSYCLVQFLTKEASLAPIVFGALLKLWPATNSKKQLLFLNELDELLDVVQPHHLGDMLVPLFRHLGKCINSPHFQVSERAIYVLNDQVIVRFITNHRHELLPVLTKALCSNSHLFNPNFSPQTIAPIYQNDAIATEHDVGEKASDGEGDGVRTQPNSPTNSAQSSDSAIPSDSSSSTSSSSSTLSPLLSYSPGLEPFLLWMAAPTSAEAEQQNTADHDPSDPNSDANANQNLRPRDVVGEMKAPKGQPLTDQWNLLGHWNPNIVSLTGNVLRVFTEMDTNLMAQCLAYHEQEAKAAQERRAKKKARWAELIEEEKRDKLRKEMEQKDQDIEKQPVAEEIKNKPDGEEAAAEEEVQAETDENSEGKAPDQEAEDIPPAPEVFYEEDYDDEELLQHMQPNIEQMRAEFGVVAQDLHSEVSDDSDNDSDSDDDDDDDEIILDNRHGNVKNLYDQQRMMRMDGSSNVDFDLDDLDSSSQDVGGYLNHPYQQHNSLYASLDQQDDQDHEPIMHHDETLHMEDLTLESEDRRLAMYQQQQQQQQHGSSLVRPSYPHPPDNDNSYEHEHEHDYDAYVLANGGAASASSHESDHVSKRSQHVSFVNSHADAGTDSDSD